MCLLGLGSCSYNRRLGACAWFCKPKRTTAIVHVFKRSRKQSFDKCSQQETKAVSWTRSCHVYSRCLIWGIYMSLLCKAPVLIFSIEGFFYTLGFCGGIISIYASGVSEILRHLAIWQKHPHVLDRVHWQSWPWSGHSQSYLSFTGLRRSRLAGRVTELVEPISVSDEEIDLFNQ